MSRFYSNENAITAKNSSTEVANSVISIIPVTETSEYKYNLIKQQSNITLLTQYDDFILKNVQKLINKYNYTKLQWFSEYYKDKSMLIAEFKQTKQCFEDNFKKGNEYEYENAVIPALLYSTIGYHGSKILLRNHIITRNVVGLIAFAKIFQLNAPVTYDRVKSYWNRKVHFGQQEKKDFKKKIDNLKAGLTHTVEDVKMENDVFLQENIHDWRIKAYKFFYQTKN